MARVKSASASNQSFATIGFEGRLWLTSDKFRRQLDAAVTERSDKRCHPAEPYQHPTLGLTALPCSEVRYAAQDVKTKTGFHALDQIGLC